jgi:arylsulfatase
MPTCLDLAGVKYPTQFKSRYLTPLAGISLVDAFRNKFYKGNETLFWEHEGSRAIRKGKWKLVAEPDQPWELYDLDKDRSEIQNLAIRYPEKVKSLKNEYVLWAKRVGVVEWTTIKNN